MCENYGNFFFPFQNLIFVCKISLWFLGSKWANFCIKYFPLKNKLDSGPLHERSTCKMMDHYCHSRRELTPTSWQRKATFDKLSTYRQTRKWLVVGGWGGGEDNNTKNKAKEMMMKIKVGKSKEIVKCCRTCWFSLSGGCVITSIVWNYVKPSMPRRILRVMMGSFLSCIYLWPLYVIWYHNKNLEWMNE